MGVLQMRRFWLAVPMVALIATAACDRSRDELEAALAEQQRVAAEKDSLLNEVLATTSLVNEINTELAAVRGITPSPVEPTEGGMSPTAENRQIVLDKVRQVIARLDSAESRLDRAESRAGQNPALRRQLQEARSNLDALRSATERQQVELLAIIDQQRGQIATLSRDLDTVRAENTRVTAERTALSDTLNTVYVAVGTEEELVGQGVAVKEGTKFLIFGGNKLLPARSVDQSDFLALTRSRDTLIQLPRDDRFYRIVSRHDTAYVNATEMEDGKLRGQLHITDPGRFWAPSRYLILVED